MTTQQAALPSLAQHQPHAAPAARWTQLHHVLKPPLSLYGRVAQGVKPVQQLGIAARSLHRCKVAANNVYRHPAADGQNSRVFAVNVFNPDNLNFASISAGTDGGICQTLTGGEGGGLNVDKCLHEVSPVDVSNIEHHALITTTVCRKVSA